jgi:transcriptional regulator with XRE-family HTH domain
VAALGGYDFGTFFLEVRRLTGWSQQALGGLVGLEQSQVSAIERGECRLRGIETIAALAHVLQIPPARLNFPAIGATVGATGNAGRKDVSWVDRRDFGLQPRLRLAAADLATQAGWMSFDSTDHDAARRLWMIALDLTRHAEHPRSTDLTVFVLQNMALQSVHLGRPKEALHLVRIGETAAVGGYPVSAATTCCLVDAQAQTYAVQGDVAGCDRALGQAEEHFAAIDPATCPPYGAWLGGVHLASFQGAAHYTLAVRNRDPHSAERALPLLGQAVEHFGSEYARPRASSLAELTGVHALAGNTDTAVTVGHQAIDAVTAVSSLRAYDRLRTLSAVLEPLHTSPGVADLRDRLTMIAAAQGKQCEQTRG